MEEPNLVVAIGTEWTGRATPKQMTFRWLKIAATRTNYASRVLVNDIQNRHSIPVVRFFASAPNDARRQAITPKKSPLAKSNPV